jgi:RHH-type rel operon transcriptional repressor/antitoxin RelB
MLAIRLPVDIEERLARLAELTGRTKTFYAREAILEHLEQLEDTYLGAKRVNTPGRTVSQDELEAELGLDG